MGLTHARSSHPYPSWEAVDAVKASLELRELWALPPSAGLVC